MTKSKFIPSETVKLRSAIGLSLVIFGILFSIAIYIYLKKSKAASGKMVKAGVILVEHERRQLRVTVSYHPDQSALIQQAIIHTNKQYSIGDSIFIKYDPENYSNIIFVADI